ncbi:ATP-binding cassette transporter-like protein [Lophiostoma macrostomum CBS 122681]|uniref:ATP-binding cassette transporter-like protein n=1 Tax=Lophiostoma macrostomum CBS 122681 TaxID=1314788 RepID=A0A6A6SU26_9PLEO|nr:ATP-binding cassette transporter-like protein [Lophiostoma macrostomum CBS 122681]
MSKTGSIDIEKGAGADHAHLTNADIRSFSWNDVAVTVKDRESKQPKDIISGINGIVHAGEMLALMGPSGSGKTTLLNVLAHRPATQGVTVKHSLYLNGSKPALDAFLKLSSYVEQEDALVGSLTVRETMYFAAQLSLSGSITKSERLVRIDALIAAFGLQDQTSNLVGTPIRKGLSGGQRRRLSVASQLITSPKILFLDEPTSGLDSAASFEVINFVRTIAKKHRILVIASIHQPSTTTFDLFDQLLLLSRGRTVYNGPISDVKDYFSKSGYEMPLYINPAEFVIDLVNIDFAVDRAKASDQLHSLQEAWLRSVDASALRSQAQDISEHASSTDLVYEHETANAFLIPLTLIHRSFIKSYRDVVAYGIRIAMYMGLAIMMGTVWLRLDANQSNIIAFTNAIFFGGAFMSFMAVAYIPAFLEDRQLFVKERSNGLYGPTAFMVANFIIGIPYLFIITILFSVIAYWLSNFRNSAEGFWIWVMWLFLDLLAAESLVVLLSSLVPIFVIALAATAFANGLWMSVNGFMVQPETLNVFWRYVFHYIDYQGYVFRGMMVNEFGKRTFECGSGCKCMYPSALEDQCKIDGKAVLATYGYKTGNEGRYVGYMLVIILGYRLLGWTVLYLRRT